MADNRAQKLAEDALNRLAAELAAGKSEGLKTYLATMSKFHRYSWGNVLQISQQRPTATQVAGIYTWNKLGRFVKEGEKGITILVPILVKEKERETSPKPPGLGDTADKKDDVYRLVGFRTAPVFDIEQTQGKPLAEFAKTTGDPKEFADKLKAFVAEQRISLEYDKSIAPALGVSSGGRIRLAPDMQPAEEFSVLAHELAHEMLHHRKDEARLPKTVVETQAEAVAYVVCRGVGLETNSAAADYIQLYNGDKKTLAESLSVIHETSARILDQLLPEQRPSPFHEKTGRSFTDTPAPSHGEPERASPAVPPPASQTPVQPEPISFDR